MGWSKGEWRHPWVEKGRMRSNSQLFLLPFGLLVPLFGSVAWAVFLIICLWLLKFLNVILQSGFISLLINSVSSNIHWFFAFSVVMGYFDYFMRSMPRARTLLWPMANATGFLFAAWILAWLMRSTGALSGSGWFVSIGSLLRGNLLPLFVAVLLLGYLVAGAKKLRLSFKGA